VLRWKWVKKDQMRNGVDLILYGLLIRMTEVTRMYNVNMDDSHMERFKVFLHYCTHINHRMQSVQTIEL